MLDSAETLFGRSETGLAGGEEVYQRPCETARIVPCVCEAAARLSRVSVREIVGMNSKSVLGDRDRIALPNIFQSLGQSLLFHGAIGMPGVARKYKLIVIALGG
jgi:hypothetical protein